MCTQGLRYFCLSLPGPLQTSCVKQTLSQSLSKSMVSLPTVCESNVSVKNQNCWHYVIFFKRSLVCLLLTVSLEYNQQVHFSYFTLALSTNSGFNCTNTLIAWMKLRPVLRRQVFPFGFFTDYIYNSLQLFAQSETVCCHNLVTGDYYTDHSNIRVSVFRHTNKLETGNVNQIDLYL